MPLKTRLVAALGCAAALVACKGEEPPEVVQPEVTTVWRPSAVPEGLGSDAASMTLLAAVRDQGLEGRVDATRGVYWKDPTNATPRWLEGEALQRPGRQLQALLARSLDRTGRCQMGMCLVVDGSPGLRWFIRTRPALDGDRFVAGVFAASDGATGQALQAWYEAIASSWRDPTVNLIGEILGDEESGNLDRALEGTKRLRAADPDNPWALSYRARIQMARKADREAFSALVRLAHAHNPLAIFALEHASSEPLLAPLEQRPVVKKLLSELTLDVPSDLDDYLAYLIRFRGSPLRLQAEVTDESLVTEVALLLLEWHLSTPEIDPEALEVRWSSGGAHARLQLRRAASGRLGVRGVGRPQDR